jgi:hypothetical protein
MDHKEIEELARQADRQIAVDRARDATLRAAGLARPSGERQVDRKVEQEGRPSDPGPIEGASGG